METTCHQKLVIIIPMVVAQHSRGCDIFHVFSSDHSAHDLSPILSNLISLIVGLLQKGPSSFVMIFVLRFFGYQTPKVLSTFNFIEIIYIFYIFSLFFFFLIIFFLFAFFFSLLWFSSIGKMLPHWKRQD